MNGKHLLGCSSSEIVYVGGYTLGFAGQTTDLVVTLTSLSGGLASSPSEGDLVFVCFVTGSTADRNLTVAGYTEINEQYSGDTYDTNIVIAYKFMPSTPDTSLTLTSGTLSTSDGGAVAIQVWRNVNQTTPFVSLGGTDYLYAGTLNAPYADPPSVSSTYLTAETAIIACGGAAGAGGNVGSFTSSDLSGFISSIGTDTNSGTVGLGYKLNQTATFNPAAFGITGSFPSTDQSAAAYSLVLQPS
jgi:hypothetical protein